MKFILLCYLFSWVLLCLFILINDAVLKKSLKRFWKRKDTEWRELDWVCCSMIWPWRSAFKGFSVPSYWKYVIWWEVPVRVPCLFLKNLPANPWFTDKRNGFENSESVWELRFLNISSEKNIFSMLAISKYVCVCVCVCVFLLATHFYHYRNFETSFFMVNDKKWL